MIDIIKKSIAASILIGMGVVVLLTIGQPVGPFLFAFGLYCICMLKLNLFTGKCGFIFETKEWKILLIILIVNLIAGWGFGAAMGLAYPVLTTAAATKIASWTISLGYLFQSILCGMIMYLTVVAYKEKNSIIGILLGVPLFIFCNAQHCIANVIILGIANTFNPALGIAIIGNFLGSIIIYYFKGDNL